jgi:thiamine biosynthesis lipoprotein
MKLRRHLSRLLTALAPVLVLVPALAARPAVQVQRQAYLMGTLCGIEGIHDGREEGLRAIESGFDAIRRVEDLLSTWRDDTPLARLAGAPAGVPRQVPAELARLLDRAAGIRQETGGAFDPAIAALVAAWDLRGGGRTPSPEERAVALARSGMERVRVDVAAGTVTLLADGLGFDAGAFGKGAGLAEAGAALDAAGLRNWIIDFGGQVLLAADGPERDIPVAHPDHRDRPAAWLRLRGLSAATSSGSQRPGHILDPRSGLPAADFGSVTVLAADPLRADALATALFVLGPEDGLALADRLQDAEALFLVRQAGELTLRTTPGAATRLIRRDRPQEAGAADATERTSGPGSRPGPGRTAARGPFLTPRTGVPGPAVGAAQESK